MNKITQLSTFIDIRFFNHYDHDIPSIEEYIQLDGLNSLDECYLEPLLF